MSDKPKCDCLNMCGDDPNIEKGTVQPCDSHLKNMKTTIGINGHSYEVPLPVADYVRAKQQAEVISAAMLDMNAPRDKVPEAKKFYNLPVEAQLGYILTLVNGSLKQTEALAELARAYADLVKAKRRE